MAPTAKEILSQKSFLSLLAISADAMLVSSHEKHIIAANPAAGRIFGYEPEEFEMLTIEDLVPERFRASHAERRREFLNHPKARTMGTQLEIWGLRKDGSEFPADVSLSPIADGLVLATIYDVTLRRHAEESLAAAGEFAEGIIATIREPLVVLDAENRVVSANRAFCRLFRMPQQDVVGQPFFDLCERRWDFTEIRQMHSDALPLKGLIEGFELRHEFPEIGWRTLKINARKIVGTTGKQKFILLAIEDITEQKRLEVEKTRMIQELERANEELKNFAYVVSHDLKAPLRAIGSLADWIAADQADRLDDEGREHLRLLIQRTRRMDGLIDGVLQYSRVGRIHETMRPVPLSPLLHEVVDSLSPPSHIKVRVDENMPTVRIERTRIQQVFLNLLSNAVRYMDKPEGIVEVAWEDRGTDWLFSVADNGPGIEPRHFERIFQLFQTLNPRDRVESTGVGLAIIKKIIEMYGGRIWLESTPCQGCTFFFTLPKTITTPKETDASP